MTNSRRVIALAIGLCLAARLSPADEKSINPKIQEILEQISEARIKAILEKLEGFGTRNTMSTQDDPVRGVGAARTWILDEFKRYSPKLQVRFEKFRVKKQGQRVFKDVDLWNVIAVLPGTRMPETQILVSGHYDSLNVGNRAAGTGGMNVAAALTPADFEKNADLPAPGVCDDGSGTAAVMELARAMSGYEFDKTLVFVAFAGEEQGLIGSSLQAAKAKRESQAIEAVLNNDIIGTEVAGNGRTGNGVVNIYSDETMDSISQQLARYIREVGERYLPSMKVNTIFLGDRLARGGDHTPFQWEGFAAVRFSTPNEIYVNQHHATDTLANMSVPYTTRVAKVNAAVAANLALAPKPPIVMPESQPAPSPGRRPGPMISRGGGYDAVLRWRIADSDAAIKGYTILTRPTSSPYWEQEIYVGKVNTFTLKDVSIDDWKFGVRAIGTNGAESLVTPYVYPPRQKIEILTVE